MSLEAPASLASNPAWIALETNRVDQRYRSLRTLIRGLCVVACVYFGRDIVATLSGRTTDLAVEVFALISMTVTLTLAGLAGLWAYLERRLRYEKVKYLTDRIRHLETRLDPRRTSSGLAPDGRTHPHDREE